MSDPITNNWTLTQLARSYAQDIVAQIEEYGGEAQELAWERADSSEHVIYHYKAHSICQNCDTNDGEAMLEEMGETPKTYDEMASAIAFGELYTRIVWELECMEEDAA